MSKKSYDFFILGTGPAGQSFALSARKNGHSVGITDPREYGGSCPNRGCDPKKVLYAAAKAMAGAQRLCGKGIVKEPLTSWPDLMQWKRTFTEPIPKGARTKLIEEGVNCFDGAAKFTGPGQLTLADGTEIKAKYVIIATGAKPAPLDIPGKKYYLDSEGFLEMEDLPKRMLIIGSGYIGSSFAQISATMGAEVTVIASSDSPVDNFDKDLNDMVVKAAEAKGIKFHFNTKAKAIAKMGDGSLQVTCTPEEGQDYTVTVDRVIHCAGRVPNVKGIGLEAAGIKFGKNGIEVDDRMRTNVKNHFAIGDCGDSGLPLTPVASYEARLLADNLLKGKDRTINYFPIPTAAFTLPPITAVGMTAEQAEKDSRDLKIKFEDTTDWFSNKHINAVTAGYKLIIDEAADLVVGAHILGDDADEAINLFAMAIHHKITITELQDMVFSYPTTAGDIKKMIG